MGLKYYLPENYENLEACEGFYIDNKAFFNTNEITEAKWNKVVEEFIIKIKRFVPGLIPVNDWDNNMGIRRFVLLKNSSVQIVMGDDERYTAIFLIIPESCENVRQAKRELDGTFKILRNYLVRKYPNAVYKRKNTWNLEPVTIDTEGAKTLLAGDSKADSAHK